MDITYDYYRVFYYVAKYSSFSRAASAMLRGQPNVTKTINKLEAQLGCRLFVRSNKGVSLTPEGEKLFHHAEIAFENLSKAESEIAFERNPNGGVITVAATEIGLYAALLKAIGGFSRDYPGVKIRLSGMNTPQALDALKNGLADFAVVTLHEKPDSGFRVRKLLDFSEPLCCKKGYLNGFTGDVFSLPYISVGRGSDTYRFYRNWMLSLGIHKEPDFEVAAADQVPPLVKAGMGIGFVSRFLAEEELRRGLIEEIPLPAPPQSRSVCLVEEKNRTLSPAANRLIQYLTK